MKKVVQPIDMSMVQPTLANVVGRKLVAIAAHPGLALFRKQKNPRMHNEIVLPGGQM